MPRSKVGKPSTAKTIPPTKRGTNHKSRMAEAPAAERRGVDNARRAKQDEFYTRLEDISNELKYYKAQLRGRVVLCNCDDPFESNFFKFFALNFNALGLKRLIATSYKPSPIAGRQLPLLSIEGLKPDGKEPYALEINEVRDLNGDGTTDLSDVEYLLRHDSNTARTLQGDDDYSAGDFRSSECVELLKQADVVITNPPFSLFREYVAQLIEYGKKFLIIGNVNAITYKDIFNLIRTNKVWLGVSIHSGDREFRVPDYYPLNAAGFRVDEDGQKYIRVKGVRWFTNMDVAQRHERIPLYRKYSRGEYPNYANHNAIEVGKVVDIPADYDGPMGVPITFLDKYNPDQFEIIGSSFDSGTPISEIAKKGTYAQGGPSFYLPNQNGTYRRMYYRIVIRKKHA